MLGVCLSTGMSNVEALGMPMGISSVDSDLVETSALFPTRPSKGCLTVA